MRYSYLTTNYNKGDVIGRSLRSITKSMTKNSELIVVDGGSTDNSIKEIKKIQNNFDNVRLIRKNANLGEGRQIALNNANGDIVVQHIDTDRFYEPEMKELINIFQDAVKKRGKDIVLATFDSLYISYKSTAQKIGGWPSLGRVEERVFVDRIISNSELTLLPAIVSYELDTKDVSKILDRIQKWTKTMRDLLRTGFSPKMLAKYNHNQFPFFKAIISDLLLPVAFVQSYGMEKYDERKRKSWKEIESWDRAFFETECGKSLFKRALYPSPNHEN